MRAVKPALAAVIAALALYGSAKYLPQQHAHEGIASCASPARSIIPETWNAPALTSATARQAVLSMPETPVPDFSAGGPGQIRNALEGRLFVDKRGPVQVVGAVDWSREDYGRYYSTQLHGLVAIGALFKSETRLPADIEALAARHVRNWALCAAHNPEINSRSWFEGTVIKRQSNLLQALNYMRRFGPIDGLPYDELVYLLDAGAAFLLDTPEVYTFGNHGIRQDMLLAATAIALPSHPRAGEMLDTADRRLRDASESLFTESGVWKEHAPGYVNYALRLLSEVEELHLASSDFNPVAILTRSESSMDFLLDSLLPDGSIPPVGRSGAERIAAKDVDVPGELQARSRSLSAYPDYGHAIVRGDHPNGLYLHFNAAQNLPAGKRHADDLSLILHHHGRAWITEGGHKSYELTGMTRFLVSADAHNTYTLDGEHVAAEQSPRLPTRLIAAERRGDLIDLEGYTERLPNGARFTRRIEVEEFDRVFIRDVLEGSGAWSGQFIFPGDLSISIDGETVTATAPDGQVMRLEFSSSGPLSFSTCKGKEKPICGWGIHGGGIAPATALAWSLEDGGTVEIAIGWE